MSEERPMCRHCKERVAIHGKRGLCYKHFMDRNIREQYRCLPTGRSAKQAECLNRGDENTATMTLEELEAFIERQRETMPLDNHPHDIMRAR